MTVLKEGTLVYLASPYSHPNRAQRIAFYEEALGAARLLSRRYRVYSPIVYGHNLASGGNAPTGWDWWAPLDRALLAACETVVLLPLPNWDKSRGVENELIIAEQLGKPVLVAVKGKGDYELEPFDWWLEGWNKKEEAGE